MGRPLLSALGVAVAGTVCVACSDEVRVPSTSTPTACVSSVSVSPPSATLLPGDAIRFQATACFVTGGWTWASSDTQVVTVDNTGFARAVGASAKTSATLIATSIVDPTIKGAALVTVVVPGANTPPLIRAISYVNPSTPASLDSLAGTIEVGAVVSNTPAVASADLIINDGVHDTTVAVATNSTTGAAWSPSLRWNTAAKTTVGTPIFLNGNYRLLVRFHQSGSSTTASTSPLAVRVRNR